MNDGTEGESILKGYQKIYLDMDIDICLGPSPHPVEKRQGRFVALLHVKNVNWATGLRTASTADLLVGEKDDYLFVTVLNPRLRLCCLPPTVL